MQLIVRQKDIFTELENIPIAHVVAADDNLAAGFAQAIGYGTDAKHAIQSATRELNRKYKQLMPGQYENPTAFKWTYLNPKYLSIYKINDPSKNLHVLLLSANH